MNITTHEVTWPCFNEQDIAIALADLAEQEAQREAIAKRWLVWSPEDEPCPQQAKQ